MEIYKFPIKIISTKILKIHVTILIPSPSKLLADPSMAELIKNLAKNL